MKEAFKEPPLLRTRVEFKIEKARKLWKKLVAQGWRILINKSNT